MTVLLYPGSPTQTNAVFVVGRSRGLVALLWRKAASVAPSAEGESECKSINNFWHLQLFGQKNALQNADCLYPLIAMQLRGLGGQNLGCWKNFSLFCPKICIYATLCQSNNYGALLMPRFAPIAPHRPIYRGLEFLSKFCAIFCFVTCQFSLQSRVCIPRMSGRDSSQTNKYAESAFFLRKWQDIALSCIIFARIWRTNNTNFVQNAKNTM